MGASTAEKLSKSGEPEMVGSIDAWNRDKDKYKLIEGPEVLQEAPFGSDDQKKLIAEVAAVETEVQDAMEEKEQAEKPNNVIKLNIEGNQKAPQESEKTVLAPEEIRIETNKPTPQEAAPEEAKVKEAVEAPPDHEAELKELESAYKDIGKILIDGWREYLRDYKHKANKLPEMVRNTVLEIARVSVDFNAERKNQNKETVDFYLPILTSLKEIYNQIVILRLIGEKTPRTVKSLDSVMRNEIGQLINIGRENQPALENYAAIVAEQLNNWRAMERIPAT